MNFNWKLWFLGFSKTKTAQKSICGVFEAPKTAWPQSCVAQSATVDVPGLYKALGQYTTAIWGINTQNCGCYSQNNILAQKLPQMRQFLALEKLFGAQFALLQLQLWTCMHFCSASSRLLARCEASTSKAESATCKKPHAQNGHAKSLSARQPL